MEKANRLCPSKPGRAIAERAVRCCAGVIGERTRPSQSHDPISVMGRGRSWLAFCLCNAPHPVLQGRYRLCPHSSPESRPMSSHKILLITGGTGSCGNAVLNETGRSLNRGTARAASCTCSTRSAARRALCASSARFSVCTRTCGRGNDPVAGRGDPFRRAGAGPWLRLQPSQHRGPRALLPDTGEAGATADARRRHAGSRPPPLHLRLCRQGLFRLAGRQPTKM